MQMPGFLNGPHLSLPGPVDAGAEAWARLPPRVRTALVLALAGVVALAMGARVRAAEHRWGGPPRLVWIAARDLAVGEPPAGALRRARLPPDAVPPAAVDAVPSAAVLSLALPAGSVLTTAHLDPRGPAAGLTAQLRAVPLSVEAGWGVTAGGWVDVWVVGAGPDASQLVARSRPVLEVRSEPGSTTALVGLAEDEVAATTGGMVLGGVLVTHAPAPRATSPPG